MVQVSRIVFIIKNRKQVIHTVTYIINTILINYITDVCNNCFYIVTDKFFLILRCAWQLSVYKFQKKGTQYVDIYPIKKKKNI